METTAGVYRVIVEGKSYIGSSIDVRRRWSQHRRTLEAGTHDNVKLQEAYNRSRVVEFELLEELKDADASVLSDRESYYIKKYNAEYNIKPATKNTNKKRVYQFDLSGKLITSYSSAQIAATANSISVSNIVHAAQENEVSTKTAGGYYWGYVDSITISKDERKHDIHLYDLMGIYIRSYESLDSCISDLKIPGERRDAMSRINRVARGLSASFFGYRFSYEKLDHLDNSKLLSIKCWYPVVQIAPDRKTLVRVYETAAVAARSLGIKTSSEITYAASTGRKCRGYYWVRLGTKWSELLEHPEGTETETESETTDGIV